MTKPRGAQSNTATSMLPLKFEIFNPSFSVFIVDKNLLSFSPIFARFLFVSILFDAQFAQNKPAPSQNHTHPIHSVGHLTGFWGFGVLGFWGSVHSYSSRKESSFTLSWRVGVWVFRTDLFKCSDSTDAAKKSFLLESMAAEMSGTCGVCEMWSHLWKVVSSQVSCN